MCRQVMRGLLILLLALLPSGAAYAQSAEFNDWQIGKDGLTDEQARRILIVVLKHENFRLTNKEISIDGPLKVDASIPSHRGFWEFGILYDSPKYGATQVLGRFAVSKFTGDVWEANLCKQFDFFVLRQIQMQVVLKTGKSRADEKEARRGLGCTDE